MPVQVSYPGVYVQEVPSGVRTITGVSTSTAVFIGMAKRGVLDKPTSVLSFAAYERVFGNDTVISEMTDQVRQFFQNGGKRAYVMRIANGAEAAEVILKDELSDKEVLKIAAKAKGVDGNSIRLEVDYNTPTPESTFNLRVFRQGPSPQGGFAEEEVEVLKDLDMDPDSGNFAVNVIKQDSALIDAERGDDFDDPDVEPLQGYALAARLFDDDAELESAIHDAIDKTGPGGAGGTTGRLRVSVDGGPFVNVAIQKPAISAANPAFDLAKAINDALLAASSGTEVEGSLTAGPGGAKQYLQIKSVKVGGSVVFRPAPQEDITAPLELGLDRGGLEVGGHARRRPAPTGLFSRLGSFETPVIAALTELADRDQTDIDEYTLEDSTGTHTFSVTLGAGGKMFEKVGESASLRHLKERLKLFANKINSDASGKPEFNWSAALHGYRLVLTAKFGNANNTVTSFTTASGHDLGAFPNGMDSPNVRYFSLGSSGASGYQKIPGVDGEDGTIPATGDYRNAFEIIDRDVDLFNLMILPRAKGQTDAQREVLWGPASTFCQKRRAFLLMDPRSDNNKWGTVDEIENEVEDLRIGLVKDHAAIYWPRLAIATNGTTKNIDPSGSIAGLMARIDANRGVWKAPAGIEADLRGVRGVQHTMSDPENGLINPQAVNAIRVFPSGIVSWGARTMDGFDNSGNDEYKYVPVRRLALFIEESLYRGLKFAVFEPNDEPLWAQIRLAAGAFMNNLFRQGAFQGQKAGDAYFVKVDSETTTQNDINLGIVNVVVGFAPLKPAEFVVITIQQMAGQIQT